MLPSRAPRLRTLAVAAVLLIALLAGNARAQTARAATADADALFQEAVELAEAGKLAAAADRFEASYRAEPALGTLLGLAMAEHRAGRLVAALGHYRLLLEQARQRKDGEREQTAMSQLSTLQALVPTVTIRLNGALPPGGELALDGTPMAPGQWDKPLLVDPGTHSIAAWGPGLDRTVHRITVGAGARELVRIDVAPRRRAAQNATGSGTAWLRGLGVASGVLGTAAVITGAALWDQSSSQFEKASGACPGPDCQTTAHQSIESGRGLQRAAGVCLAIGGIALAAGVTLWVAGHQQSSQSHAKLQVGPGSLRVVGVF